MLEIGICRFWVVHFKGGYAEFSVGIFFKMGPAGSPRIPGWSLGRVLSTWYQSIRLFDSVDMSSPCYFDYLIYLASSE